MEQYLQIPAVTLCHKSVLTNFFFFCLSTPMNTRVKVMGFVCLCV